MKLINKQLNAEKTKYLVTVRLIYKKHEKKDKRTVSLPVFARSIHDAEGHIKAHIKKMRDVYRSEILAIEDTSTGTFK